MLTTVALGLAFERSNAAAMDLGERKKKILQAIIDDYIETGEPVGSRTMVKKHDISLSPATIRNEMADLEEMGFLEKPHTSAGRIPSMHGYRFYVNSLMRQYKMSIEETDRLRSALEIKIGELDDLIAEASNIVSRLTDYTVIASSPRAINPVVRNIKLLLISGRHFLLTVMTSHGGIKNAGIETSEPYPEEAAAVFSVALNETLSGRAPGDLSAAEFERLKNSSARCAELFRPVLAHLFEWFDTRVKKGVYAGGAYNIFNFPEYKDIDRAKEFIRFIDNRDNIYSIVYNGGDGEKVQIKIGDENGHPELKDCSVIVSNYEVDGQLKGSIGVVGPMRMDYAKIISSLEVVTDRLNAVIYKLFFDR